MLLRLLLLILLWPDRLASVLFRHLDRVRPREPAQHLPRRPAPTSRDISSASGESARHGCDEESLPRQGFVETLLGANAAVPASRHQIPRNAPQRARRDQCADPGVGGRHHPPRHDPYGRLTCRRKPRRANAAAGARRTRVRSAVDQVDATINVVRRVMVDAPLPVLNLVVPLVVDAQGRLQLGRSALGAMATIDAYVQF